jgi:flagellar hook-associated protein 1 FlgK
MGSLFGSILSATNSMRAFQQGLNVVQSNVVNASTPGYVKQTQSYSADTFDIAGGAPGGVMLGPLLSSRNEYAEQLVRNQQHTLGEADQRATDLSAVEPVFAFTDGLGISGALDGFFAAAADLTVSPNGNPARQGILDHAQQVATAFNTTATALTDSRSNADREITNVVASINDAVATICRLNEDVRTNAQVRQDPGFDSRLHNALESLSEFTDFTAIQAADGTTTILIAGQTLALIGDHQYNLSTELDGAGATVLDSSGKSINSQITSGRLGALLSYRNETIPSYQTDLNQLAGTFADRVNSILQNGLDATGNPPLMALFAYDAGFGEAGTLRVNALTTTDVAAADGSAPGGNGNAITLASLAHAKELNGFSYTEAYGNLVGRVGRDLAAAKGDVDTRSALVSQAKSFRAQSSEVSLDEEAAKLLAFQKSYEASAKLVNALNDMTDSILALLR